MAKPSEKLASSLEALKGLQDKGIIAIQASDISRTHRDRLLKNGFLQRVIKGWYIPCNPNDNLGESTAWYTSFWHFCSSYLNQRFGDNWCLSPEVSVSIHAGNWTVPNQLLVRTPEGNNNKIELPYSTSLFITQYSMPEQNDIIKNNGLQIYSLPSALISCSPNYFQQNEIDVKTALSAIGDSSDILGLLLQGGHSRIAGRLTGAFRDIGRDQIATDIIETMRKADYDVREVNPFSENNIYTFNSRERSPYVNRLHLLWNKMREDIIDSFPKVSSTNNNAKKYLEHIDDIYKADAYNSLSIEGYRVSLELIQRVQEGKWNPETNDSDKNHKDALAARGYWQAFQAVKKSVAKVLSGANAGKVASKDHRVWFREMFTPNITAGLLQPADLAGYRNSQVYIRHSMHVPPNCEAIRDLMPAFFELLENEPESSVRIVLGHFFFVYIHPYMDGNGRLGRFLMNVMLASGNYQWVVVPYAKRNQYMKSLEDASVHQNIKPFRDFIAGLIKSNG